MQIKIILFESWNQDTQKYTQPIELLYTATKVIGKNLYQLDVLPDANWKKSFVGPRLFCNHKPAPNERVVALYISTMTIITTTITTTVFQKKTATLFFGH